jgi:hypothetical protein
MRVVPDERIHQGTIFLPGHSFHLKYVIGWAANVVHGVVKSRP